MSHPTLAAPLRRPDQVELVELGGVWVHKSLPALYQQRVTEWGHDLCEFRKVDGGWRGATAAQGAQRVRRLALGLLELGVVKGDRVALLCETRSEWGRVDMAILHCGAVTVGIYPSLPAGEVAWQLEHAEAKVAIVEDAEQLDKVRAGRAGLPRLERVIVIEPPAGPLGEGELTLAELERRGEQAAGGEARFERAWRDVGPDDLATIIYTSGTTGLPKGAMLTHGNLTFTAHAAASIMPHTPDDRSVVFLPMAHALQRVAGYVGLLTRATAYYATSLDALMDEIRAVEPTIQVSVPRIWEKLHARLLEVVRGSPPARRRIFDWGLDVGRRASPYLKRGERLPVRLALAHALAKRVVHDRLKERVFGRNVRFLTSGGAPIATEILEFFHALGLLILEGWGLTETAAPATLNTPDAYRFGTVGRAIPGTQVKVAPDGELLVRGPGVFRGYWRDPEASTEAFTEDFFFKTGDIGEVDPDGFVRITDRKKNLIVLANGKKVAPQKLENHFKRVPLVAHTLVVGDKRPYLVALFSLDPDEVGRLARAQGLAHAPADRATPDDLTKLLADPAFTGPLERAIAEQNEALARFEQLKAWRVLPEVWSTDDGSLTPTLKLRRQVLERRHADALEAMYRK
jgi:long-chain acyl-CoA synthetase